MARIDLLTAQMCRRTAKRLKVQCDEKMQFFGGDGELLGEGAALSGPMIHEFLLQIAPIPFDGVPVSFPYKGCDGEFKILVAAQCRGFEIHAFSFTTPAPTPLQSPSISSPTKGAKTAFDCRWTGSGKSYKPSMPVNDLSPGTYGRHEENAAEAPQDAID